MARFYSTSEPIRQIQTPFFFLIDFEQQKPMLCPLNETATQNIYVQFPAYRNLDWQEKLPTEAFYLRKHPMNFTAYQQGFEFNATGTTFR